MNNVDVLYTGLMREVGISSVQIDEFKSHLAKRKVPYGWYKGKGTPEELEGAIITISKKVGLPLESASSEVIRQFMKLYGLGIDCSGYVYQTLLHSFGSIGMDAEFIESLDWSDKTQKRPSRAGVFIFTQSASVPIALDELRALDLVFFKTNANDYNHVAIILNYDEQLKIAQSQLSSYPDGVNISSLTVENKKPVFSFQPEIGKSWSELYKSGHLEFRRLSVIA